MTLRRRIARWLLLDLWGWRIEGPIPYDTPKCVVAVYPHTSNWDFPIGVLFRPAFGIDIHFAGKDSLFRPPLGGLMRWLGGRPVVRSRRTNFVEAVAEIFRRNEVFRLCLTPEGTRGRVEKLRSGYHYIALEADVPIVFCAFHWAERTMRWSEPFRVTEDYDRTLRAFHSFFRGTIGFHPADAYPIPPATADASAAAS